MVRFVLIVMAVAGLSACRTKALPDVAQTKQAVDSINTRVEGWFLAGQADSISSVFAQDALLMPPNDKALVGRDSIRTFWASLLKMGIVNFDLRSEDLIALDTVAVERGQYVLKFTAGPNSAVRDFEDRGNYLTVWRRESDGQMRIVWDAAVSSIPLPVTPPSGGAAERPGS